MPNTKPTIIQDIDERMRAAAPKDALDIIEHLNHAGYDAYLVGGCVRDTLEGATPHDWDITTAATPQQMKEAVPYHAIDTGLAHGTITFMVDGEPYETTVFRTDGDYTDGRHPDNVSFAATVEEDLARRDFTVNAMAWSPSRGLVDPYGGADDLRDNSLRAVGDPLARFQEDGLRVMRAVRFASTHGYEIEDNTAAAMHDSLDMLSHVSAERITSEFLKTLGAADGEHMARTFDKFKDVMFSAVPELSALDEMGDQENPNHDRSLFQHALDTMSSLPADPVLRFTGLVHDIGKPASKSFDEEGVAHYYGHMEEGQKIVEQMCRRMKMSADDTEKMSFLVANHDLRPRETEKSARRFIVKMGTQERLDDMLSLMEADIRSHSPEAVERVLPRFNAAKEFIAKEQEKQMALKVSDLAINGHDLMEMGYKPGPAMGAALNEMFAAVIDGELENNKKALEQRARTISQELADGQRVLSSNRKSFERPDGTPCAADIGNVKPDEPVKSAASANKSKRSDNSNSVGKAENKPYATSAGGDSENASGTPARGTSHRKSRSGLRSGASAGDGRVYVSPHVRGGVKVAGYWRSSAGARK